MPVFWPFRKKELSGNLDLPESLRSVLEKEMAMYNRLPAALAQRLNGRVAEFLGKVRMEGCGGLELTDRMKVVIAGYACLLRLGHDEGVFPDLSTVLVYPDDFLVPVGSDNELGAVSEGMEWRAGESWPLGAVVLSWKEIERDLRSLRRPARNLVLHEFAHQLDASFRLSDGVDADSGEALMDGVWHRVLARAYRGLAGLPEAGRGKRRGWSRRVGLNQGDKAGSQINVGQKPQLSAQQSRSVLDPYGAENPAELFAVATESFFLDPVAFRRSDPEFYSQLAEFYNVNPAVWLDK
jgi:MtfA peptidase